MFIHHLYMVLCGAKDVTAINHLNTGMGNLLFFLYFFLFRIAVYGPPAIGFPLLPLELKSHNAAF